MPYYQVQALNQHETIIIEINAKIHIMGQRHSNMKMCQVFPNTFHPGLPVNPSSSNNMCAMVCL